MMRVGGGLSGIDLMARNALTRATDMLAQTSLRLATLQRVNRGSDDPAGVIAIGTLRAELEALEQASDNADRAASVVHVADSGLNQASSLIRSIRGNTIAAASGTASPEEVAAHQIEIDAALDALDRIGYTTGLGGRNLLDGSAGYAASGANAEQIANIEIHSRASNETQEINVEVVSDAVVEVDGQQYTADDGVVHVRTNTLNADITLAEGFVGQADPITVTGGALTFLFAPDPNHTVSLSLPRVDSHALGGASGRLADLRTGGSASLESGNLNRAFAILEDAENEVLASRARLGAFERNAIDANSAVLDSSTKTNKGGRHQIQAY